MAETEPCLQQQCKDLRKELPNLVTALQAGSQELTHLTASQYPSFHNIKVKKVSIVSAADQFSGPVRYKLHRATDLKIRRVNC